MNDLTMASTEVDLSVLQPTVAVGHRGMGMVKEEDSHGEWKINFPLTQGELAAVFAVFTGFGVALLSIYLTMPNVDYQVLKLPHNVDELQSLTEYVKGYAQDYTLQVVLGYCVVYIFMQTFMIPGTVFFSLLAGALFGVPGGIVLVLCTATAGALSCFFLSKMVGRPIAYWLWPEKLHFFSAEIAKREKKLLNYMLLLRITPSLPNTFVNFASPIVDVPYQTFFLATFFGLIPAAFVTVRAGLALNDLKFVSLPSACLGSGGAVFIHPAIPTNCSGRSLSLCDSGKTLNWYTCRCSYPLSLELILTAIWWRVCMAGEFQKKTIGVTNIEWWRGRSGFNAQ